MANRTLSDLPIATTIAGSDILHCRQVTADKSISQTKIAEYAMNLSDYSPTVVSVTGATHIISAIIRKQLLLCTISSNCTMTFPGSYGDAQEIIIRNESGSTANVIGLPNSEVLYPGLEITFIWNGSAWVKRGFTTHILTGSTAPTITPSFIGQNFIDSSNDRFWRAVGTGSSNDWIEIQKTIPDIIVSYSDYTITDTIASGTILIGNPNTSSQYGEMIYTLPTHADNIGKRYIFEYGTDGNINGGLIKIVPETPASEKLLLDDEETTLMYLFQVGDRLEVFNDGYYWKITKININLDTGWVNRDDYTGEKIGLVPLTYDNLSGTILIGSTVVETGGNACIGVVLYDSGTQLLLFKVQNGGVFTNNNALTFSNGATADVDEISGNNKNQDSYIRHGLGLNIERFPEIDLYISSDGTWNNLIRILHESWASATSVSYGRTYYQISTNEIEQLTGKHGISYMDTTGDILANVIDTEDYYVKFILKINR